MPSSPLETKYLTVLKNDKYSSVRGFQLVILLMWILFLISRGIFLLIDTLTILFLITIAFLYTSDRILILSYEPETGWSIQRIFGYGILYFVRSSITTQQIKTELRVVNKSTKKKALFSVEDQNHNVYQIKIFNIDAKQLVDDLQTLGVRTLIRKRGLKRSDELD